MALFYAIRKGKVTGVVNSWEECKERTQGVSGAEYKGFNSIDDAEKYLAGESTMSGRSQEFQEPVKPTQEHEANVYIRGSYNIDRADIGVVIDTSVKCYNFFGELYCPEYERLKGFAGELLALWTAVQLCIELGCHKLNIVFTYDGVQKWAEGTWTAKDELPIRFSGAMRNLRLNNQLQYNFMKKPKGLSIEGMNMAEMLMKRSKNIGEFIDIEKVRKCQLTVNDVPLYSIS